MTDAPKIDTQAPDTSSKMPPRIWATYYADHPGTAGLWDHVKRYEWEDRVEYERRGLADARAAAAWIEGRDAAVADVRENWEEGVPPAEFAERAEQVEPPEDLAAALDRLIAEAEQRGYAEAMEAERAMADALIAERVRKARAYAREAIIHASNNLSTHLEQYHDHEEETPERSNLRGIMHHLEGTLIGMDDDEDALIARLVREARLAAFDEIVVAVANAARGSKEGQT